MRSRFRLKQRTVAIVSEDLPEPHGVGLYRDEGNQFARAYGPEDMMFLVRPDGYIGWRGRSWRSGGLITYFSRMSGPA
jgi:hypothetical protein